MAETYNPRLFVKDHVAKPQSTFAETAHTTDIDSLPKQTGGAWTESAFSTDTPTSTLSAVAGILLEKEW